MLNGTRSHEILSSIYGENFKVKIYQDHIEMTPIMIYDFTEF